MTLFATRLPAEPHAADVTAALAEIEQAALSHDGVLHPWLTAFAHGGHRDVDAALHRFACEYHGYVEGLPHCFEVGLGRLRDPVQQMPWQRRLAKELGYFGDADTQELRRVGIRASHVVDVPRPELFRRFAAAVGVRVEELAAPTPAARQWREGLLAFLADATPAEAVGALAFGTELIERRAHSPLLRALLETGAVRREALVFFELVAMQNERHLQELREIARALAETPGSLAELRIGMRTALELRRDFHDQLAARCPQFA